MPPSFDPIPESLDQLANRTVHAAFLAHSQLGPGLLEGVYEACLEYELTKLGFSVQRQIKLPIEYDGVMLDANLRLDLLIEKQLIVEIKSLDGLAPVHTAQLMTYLKLTRRRLGLLINFNVPLIKEGIKRVVL